ncbi:MAG TPA: prenyltransferase [Methanomassiliicoccales archaeon]|nr:prenyltransferase [Methanomassiliicoccales archaeon]
MKPYTLVSFARIRPLAAWSISGSAIGVGLALYLTGWEIVALLPMILAIVAVIIMQYVAHPLNDIMDYELDRQAPISETRRVKPLVDGSITVKETKTLSLFLIAVILVILGYLIIRQPVLLIPAAYGLIAVIGYNSSRVRLAYRPYTELYFGIPINVLTVSVISFIGSGIFSVLEIVVGVLFSFMASSFFISMMSMDYPTDRLHKKNTTVVSHPRLRWCTYFPLIGMAFAMISPALLYQVIGWGPALLFAGISAAFLLVVAIWGKRVDDVRLSFLGGTSSDVERRSGDMRLNQLYLAIVYAFLIAAYFAMLGAGL